MDSISALRQRIRIGNSLRLIFYTDEGPVAVVATLVSSEPVTVAGCDSSLSKVEAGTRAMLLCLDKASYLKSEVMVQSVVSEGGTYTVKLTDKLWEEVDRRRYPRYALQVSVTLKAIQEVEGVTSLTAFHGSTEDISIGGAWIQLDEPIAPGSLVEFQAALTPTDIVRVLGVIAHGSSERGGYGVEFLDYMGSARYTLHNFLKSAA